MIVCRDQLVSRERIIRAMRHQRLFVSFVSFLSPLVCVIAIGTALPVAQQSNATRNPLAASAESIAAGRVVFDQACQSCHAPSATGDRGPALNSGVFTHGSEDGDLFRTIREGLTGTQMPPFRGLTDEQIWQTITYLRSLSGVRANETAANATPSRGNRTSGEALFFGRAGCVTCHEVNGRGGIVGPDLSAVARASADAIRQKILNPAAPFAAPVTAGRGGPVGRGGAGARPVVIVAKTRDGREIRGVRRNEDTFSLQMIDASGSLHLFDKLQLADVRVENTSLMPGDYGTRLAAGEIDDLVAYLSTLRERNLTMTSASTMSGGGITFDRLVNAEAEPHNWLMYWGNFRGTHYSGLKQVTPANVGQLQAAWAFPMPGPSVLEATPIVVDGVMYTTQPGEVVALDARTGRQIWRYARPQKVRNPYEINPFNRGVAVVGNRLFFGTLDAALVALDARTGLPLWETQIADTMLGHSLTSAPLMVKDKVSSGSPAANLARADSWMRTTRRPENRCGAGTQCRDPASSAHDTWLGDSWKLGGSPMWLTGSYDPELNTVYWTVGNPGPQIDRSVRGDLDNLFSDSVVALDPDTGQRKWHYQFTPNDGHDWDSAQDLILVDRCGTARCASCCCTPIATDSSTCSTARTENFYQARRSSTRTGTPASTRTDGRMQVPGSNSSSDWKLLRLSHARRRHEFPGAVVQPDHWLDVSRIRRKRSAVREHAGSLRIRPPVHRPNQRGWRSCGTEARRAGGVGGHQGARSRNREDDVGFQDLSGLVDQWRARHRRQRAVRRDPRRQSGGARRKDRKASLALLDRRQHGGVADELRRERPPVRRDRRGQHGVLRSRCLKRSECERKIILCVAWCPLMVAAQLPLLSRMLRGGTARSCSSRTRAARRSFRSFRRSATSRSR